MHCLLASKIRYNKKRESLLYRARSLPVENLLPQNAEPIINDFQLSTEVAQWGTPSCSRPQLATDNGVRYGKSNRLVAPSPSLTVPP